MSQYIEFFVRKNDVFCPIYTGSASSAIGRHIDAPWEKIRPITSSDISRLTKDIQEEITSLRKIIANKEKLKSDIWEASNPLSEKIAEVNEIEVTLEEDREDLDCLIYGSYLVGFFQEIIHEAEQTKYYKNQEPINPEEYLYAGWECGSYVTKEDIEEK